MGKRMAVTKVEINRFMVRLPSAIGNRRGNLLGADCHTNEWWNGHWRETAINILGENGAWSFVGRRSKHNFDGRVRSTIWAFEGDRDAFLRWVLMLEAMGGVKVFIPADWRAVMVGERAV